MGDSLKWHYDQQRMREVPTGSTTHGPRKSARSIQAAVEKPQRPAPTNRVCPECQRQLVVGILDSPKPICVGCLKTPAACDCEQQVRHFSGG